MRRWSEIWLLGLLLVALAAGPPTLPLAAQEPLADDPDELSEAESPAGGYLYDPAGRRDPFKSLLAAREPTELRGPRPEGIPGLLIDEIDLTGIFVTPEGPVAQVLSPEQDKSYLLREGDQLYDGDVVQIDRDRVLFKQILDDPTALKPFREVEKKLNP